MILPIQYFIAFFTVPGISESLANTLKQKELLMERIKQYKEISKRPIKTSAIKKDTVTDSKVEVKKVCLKQYNLKFQWLSSSFY